MHKVLLKPRKRGFPAGSVVKNPCSHGILSLQACRCCCCLVAKLCPALLQPPGLVARQAPLSMGFPRQAYWSGWPFPSPEDLPNPEIELRSPAVQVDWLLTEPRRSPYNVMNYVRFAHARVVVVRNRIFGKTI